MKWELKMLEDDVRKAQGGRYADELHALLQSAAWKKDIAYYHACESERIIKEAVSAVQHAKEGEPDYVSTTKAILLGASPDEADGNIILAQFKAEAHIIASAQSLHSLCDIISGITYLAFQIDKTPNPPQLNKLNLHSINWALNKLPQYSPTAAFIDAAVSSDDFKYLAAYVNTTKHKSLIHTSLSASFAADHTSGMRISKFSYTDRDGNTETYKSIWSRDFLFTNNYNLLLKLVAIGNSLNDYFV